MKVSPSIRSKSKNTLMLALTLSAGFLSSARADDIPASDPTAPCGELHLIGQQSYIYNRSVFTFNVQFQTSAGIYEGFWLNRSINAGAVKYLDNDAHGDGVWRDTGRGDYRSVKTYTIPAKPNSVVTIAYCGSRVPNVSNIIGKVLFTANPDEPVHPIPDGYVNFQGWADWTDSWRRGDAAINQQVFFDKPVTTPYVSYDKKSDASWEYGSLTICPKDPECKIP